MDNLQASIVSNYKYMMRQLRKGYRMDLKTLMDQVLFENYRHAIDNAEYYETQLADLSTENELEYVI